MWIRVRRRIGRWLASALLIFVAASLLLVVPLRWFDPVTSAFMLRHRLIATEEGVDEPPRYHWVDLNGIAPALRLAVVAAEDQKFPTHSGFDVASIADAVGDYVYGGEPLRGASTISQQVAKNLYLWPAHSFLRKGLEAWFTALLELTLPKRRILEIYLNLAQFGPRTYGAGASARQFFGIPAKAITTEQAALLAAALPNPRHYRVTAPTPYMRQRQHWIVEQMRSLGGPAWLRQALD